MNLYIEAMEDDDYFGAWMKSTKATSWVPMPPSSTSAGTFKTYADTTGLVVYENSVPSYEQVFGLCEFLEDEYDKIRDFARDVLGNVWQHFPAIPVYLSKECPEKSYPIDREMLMEKIRKICAECDKEKCVAPDCWAFDSIFETKPIIDPISGKYYDGEEPHIVLYFKNTPSPKDIHDSKFTAAITKTLAHEYLHFLHCAYAGCSAYNSAKKELKEALADFFGVLYALDQKYIAVANDRYNLWKDREKTGWPYSYALKFFKIPYKMNLMKYSDAEIKDRNRKFRYVFKNTIDPDNAFEILKS